MSDDVYGVSEAMQSVEAELSTHIAWQGNTLTAITGAVEQRYDPELGGYAPDWNMEIVMRTDALPADQRPKPQQTITLADGESYRIVSVVSTMDDAILVLRCASTSRGV